MGSTDISGHHGNYTVQQVANEWAANLVKDARAGELTKADAYGTVTRKAVIITLAGGGPGADLTVVLDSDGDVVDGFYSYYESNGIAAVELHKSEAQLVYNALMGRATTEEDE